MGKPVADKMTPSDLNNAYEFLSRKWFTVRGLIVVAFFLTWTEAFLCLGKIPHVATVLILLLSLLVLIRAWHISKRPPRTKKGKIGFVTCITCEDDEESKKIKNDLIVPLHTLVKQGLTGGTFHFIEIPDHISQYVVDIDDAQKLRFDCRGHFLIYGKVRRRSLAEKEVHFIELAGVVSHKEIPAATSQKLSREFAELLPRKVNIAVENDILSFQFTSEWIEIVSRYIIGLAAEVSGDLVYAEQLFNDAATRLDLKGDLEFPTYRKLQERIPIRISELYEARATTAYEAWVASNSNADIDLLGCSLSRLAPGYKTDKALTLRAIFYVLNDKRCDLAKAMLEESTNKDNSQWHFNMAFLCGYARDLRSAIRHYRKAVDFPIEDEILGKVHFFILRMLEREPENHHLNYCLGFFLWKAKRKLPEAIERFQLFLSNGNSDFPKEIELANQWLGEIKKSLREKN
jgi:hypothetical protein